MKINFQFPEKLQGIFDPSPYKVFYGGRGGAKSHSIARSLLTIGASKRIRVLCCREFQASMADSVHKLLKDIIMDYGLNVFYTVYNNAIVGKNGTEFLFVGLGRNVASIKSIERISHCWVEEAQTITQASLDVLIPTIRAEDAEIWFSLNPIMETDPVYDQFILHPPKGTMLFNINWQDNPWFPRILYNQMQEAYIRDPVKADNVWGGIPRSSVEGAIYLSEMQKIVQDKRICRVPYDPSLPVNTYWDLGRNDTTAVWFGQHTNMEHRFIDYYEKNGLFLTDHLKAVKERPYLFGDWYFPHDIEADGVGQDRTRLSILANFGIRKGHNLEVVKRISDITEGIEITRQVLHKCWFDEEKCADGILALKSYRRKYNEENKTFSDRPVHDWSSNSADAIRQFAQGFKDKRNTRPTPISRPYRFKDAGAGY